MEFKSYRVKRDTSQSPSSLASSVSTPTSSTNADKIAANDLPTVDSTPHLLGAYGTGQRKDYNATSGTNMPTVVSEPMNSNSNINNTKISTINKSLGAVAAIAATTASSTSQTTEATDTDEMDDLIGTIDESEEAINKTLDEKLSIKTQKVDYFQYYNSTKMINKNKSDEYWSEKKDYITSHILSKSHRRAIVSSCFSFVLFIQMSIYFLKCLFMRGIYEIIENLPFRRCN